MCATPDMAEKHARILGELAEFGLDFARKLHGQGMAAETPEETASLARAFHSVSRSVRQTLALEARLARDAQRQDRDDRAEAQRAAQHAEFLANHEARAPIEARRSRISSALERIIDAEHEDEDEAERLFSEVFERLGDEADAPDFLEHALDDQIARLCRDFGLPPPSRPLAPAPHTLGDWTGPP
jgi:hypothetical protein